MRSRAANTNGEEGTRIRNSMKKKIFHNGGLKLGSLVLAYLLWLLVKQFGDPVETGTFRGIPVTLTNTELLDEQNKVYQVLDNTDTVTVTVRAPGSIIDDLDASDIVAIADMSKLTEINTIAITFSVQNGDTVDSIRGNPDVLRLTVEDRSTKPVNVTYSIVGEVADGYIVAGVQQDQNRIQVTGPESAVSRIRYANLEIDVSGATSDVSANVDIQLFDAEGNLLDLPSVKKSVNNVRLKVEVLAAKEVPIIVNYTGLPADGFLTTGVVRCNPSTVLIAGTLSELNNVSSIVIPAEELDITDATGNVERSIDIRRLVTENGVRLADSSFNGIVTATVYIEPEVERTLEISSANISILNVPEGVRVRRGETDSPYRLVISGLEADISQITEDMLGASIDLAVWMKEENMEELLPGEYQIPVTFNLPESITTENTVTMQIIIVSLEGM